MTRKQKGGQREGISSRALMRRTTTGATLTGDTDQRDAVQKLLMVICGALQLSLNIGPVTQWCPENLDATLCRRIVQIAMPQFRVRIDDLGCLQEGIVGGITPARFQICVLPAWIWMAIVRPQIVVEETMDVTSAFRRRHGETSSWKARRCSPPWSFDWTAQRAGC